MSNETGNNPENIKDEVSDAIRELGKKEVEYDRQVAVCGLEAANNVLFFWMKGYMSRNVEVSKFESQLRVNADLLDNANDNFERFKEWGNRMAAQVHYLTNQKQATANTLNVINEKYAADNRIMNDEVAMSIEGIVSALISPDPIQPMPPEPPQKKYVFTAKLQGHDLDDVEQALRFALEDIQDLSEKGTDPYKAITSAGIVKLEINEHQTFASYKTESEAYMNAVKAQEKK